MSKRRWTPTCRRGSRPALPRAANAEGRARDGRLAGHGGGGGARGGASVAHGRGGQGRQRSRPERQCRSRCAIARARSRAPDPGAEARPADVATAVGARFPARGHGRQGVAAFAAARPIRGCAMACWCAAAGCPGWTHGRPRAGRAVACRPQRLPVIHSPIAPARLANKKQCPPQRQSPSSPQRMQINPPARRRPWPRAVGHRQYGAGRTVRSRPVFPTKTRNAKDFYPVRTAQHRTSASTRHRKNLFSKNSEPKPARWRGQVIGPDVGPKEPRKPTTHLLTRHA